MAPTDLFVAGLNFTQAESFSAGLYRFAADRSLVLSGAEAWLPASASAFWNEWSSKILEWLSRPGKLSPSVLDCHPVRGICGDRSNTVRYSVRRYRYPCGNHCVVGHLYYRDSHFDGIQFRRHCCRYVDQYVQAVICIPGSLKLMPL